MVQHAITLTEQQQRAYDGFMSFVSNPGPPYVALLQGFAGTGKTTLLGVIVAALVAKRSKLLCVAPTHKARKVLQNIIGRATRSWVDTCTVSGLLAKTRSHSYVGTKRFVSGGDGKFTEFDIILADETSMDTDEDAYRMMAAADKYKVKVFFIGDRFQGPNPSQTLEVVELEDGTKVCQKKDCCVFSEVELSFQLDQVIRQSAESTIPDYYVTIRENLLQDTTFEPTTEPGDVEVFVDATLFADKIRERFVGAIAPDDLSSSLSVKVLLLTRIFVYTNESVGKYNEMVRRLLGFTNEFVVNEILTGYNNVGWPSQIVEMGQDYIITRVQPTTTHTLPRGASYNTPCAGTLVTVKPVYSAIDSFFGPDEVLFFPDILAPQNVPLLERLRDLAESVNAPYSSKEDFKRYSALKNLLVFRTNIYWFSGVMFTEEQLKRQHPLLFTRTLDVINDSRQLVVSHLAAALDMQYPTLRTSRLVDRKVIADQERMCDKFQILERDIDYGIACTTHKSQGSTVHTVFVDDADFEKLVDRYNPRYGMMERRIKEKNQLRYVAYTRASKKLYVLSA